MKQIICFLLLSISTLFSPQCLSAPKVIQPDPSFQMVVADGWELIDAESMSIFNRINGKSSHQYYNFGIRRIKSKHTFDYPYVLVQIKNDGKFPSEQEIKELRKGDSSDLINVGKYKKIVKNEFYFDQLNNSFFIISEINDGAGSVVNGLSVSYLTKNGRVTVNCYYEKPQMKKYIKDLTYMATSILINSWNKYGTKEVYVDPSVMRRNKKASQIKQLEQSNQSPIVAALNHGVIGGAFAAVVMVIGFVIRRLMRAMKKKPE